MFFAFLSVPRTFELLFHGRNTLLNHVFLINDSVNICLFSKSGNSLIILFIYKNSELYQHSRDAGAALFFIYATTFFPKGGVPHELCSYPFPCAIPLQQQRAYAYSYLGYRVRYLLRYRLHHRYWK